MKLIWCSDVHLNFLPAEDRRDFYRTIRKAGGDAVVLSGDIGESHDVEHIIKDMEQTVGVPVYFVLGNHDFYGDSVDDVKERLSKLNYLGATSVVPLTDDTAMVGVDGWGDCRNGDYKNSRLVMSDWMYIKDLHPCYQAGPRALKIKLQKLADSDASLLKRRVNATIKKGYKNIIIVTHVPPLEDACLYAGRKSTPDGLPFFSSKILGDKILPIAEKNPDVKFIWLCGHTHSRVRLHKGKNFTVQVADAQYFWPKIEEVIDVA